MRPTILFMALCQPFMGCDSKSDDTSSADPGESGSDEAALTEVCDGIDNDDDGLTDPEKLVAWYDPIADKLHLDSLIGVTSIHTKQDGEVGFFGPTNPYNSEQNEWAIAASNGVIDAQQIEYFDPNGNLSVLLDDTDGDGQVDRTASYAYQPDSDLISAYRYYYNSVFRMVRQDEWSYTSADTPDGETQISNRTTWAMTDWDGNFYHEECFADYSPTTAYSDCRSRYTAYTGMDGRIEIQQLWVEGVRRLQHRISNGSPSTETLYDSSGNTVLVRWGEAGPKEVWTWGATGELESRVATSENGEHLLSATYYTHRDGLIATVEIDEDGDGEIDFMKTMTHDGDRLTSYAESRFDEEISVYVQPPLPGMTIAYDASQSVRQISYDWDGDGIGDVTYDYAISCEPAEHGFDPHNFDHDGDGYSVNDGDCDDENPNLTPDEGC